jgi:hypothetical protein
MDGTCRLRRAHLAGGLEALADSANPQARVGIENNILDFRIFKEADL